MGGCADSAAAAPSATVVMASVSASGQLASAFAWTVQVAASPATQMVPVGSSANVQYSITTTKSAQASPGALFHGSVCVRNVGPAATRGLAITDSLRRANSSAVLSTVAVDLSARPSLSPGQAACYPFSIAVPSAVIAPGGRYTNTAQVTIMNLAGRQGVAAGPSPASTGSLPTSSTVVDSSITVNDTNGRSMTFAGGGTQSYTQAIPCTQASGAHTIDGTDTATIASTGQTASAEATVHCGAPTTISTMLSPSTIRAGGSVTDQATISGADPNAAGTITYSVYSDDSCQTAFADATPSGNAVSGAAAPTSAAVSFPTTGTYWWTATYSGDPAANTLGSSSACAAEPLTVSGWQSDALVTYTQNNWTYDPTAAPLLANNFYDVYSVGAVIIGGQFELIFTTPAAVQAFIPATGAPAALTENDTDETSSAAGSFAGNVLALQLDVDFSDAGLLSGTSGLKFGDLTLCNLTTLFGTDDVSSLNGMTVRQLLSAANVALGAGSTGLPLPEPIDDLDSLTRSAVAAFGGGTPSSFAQTNLTNGPCT